MVLSSNKVSVPIQYLQERTHSFLTIKLHSKALPGPFRKHCAHVQKHFPRDLLQTNDSTSMNYLLWMIFRWYAKYPKKLLYHLRCISLINSKFQGKNCIGLIVRIRTFLRKIYLQEYSSTVCGFQKRISQIFNICT